MDRRSFLLGALLALTPALPSRAAGVDDYVRQLEAQGYDGISVGRTLLGRLRIEAVRDGERREIIVNRGTGEILRDWSGQDDDLLEGTDGSRSGSGGSGSGSSGSGSSGSGNSGSGSSGSGSSGSGSSGSGGSGSGNSGSGSSGSGSSGSGGGNSGSGSGDDDGGDDDDDNDEDD